MAAFVALSTPIHPLLEVNSGLGKKTRMRFFSDSFISQNPQSRRALFVDCFSSLESCFRVNF